MKEDKELREEFLAIRDKYIGAMICVDTIYRIDSEYERFFIENDMRDVKFKIEVSDKGGVIELVPLNTMSRFVIRGILNEE